MAVSAHQRVRIDIGFAVDLFVPGHLGQVFQIHLMANTGTRRYHAKVIKRRLPPAQKLVTLLIAFHLDGNVVGVGRRIGKAVHHHGMIDYQIHLAQRIDDGGIFAQVGNRIAHGRQIHHCRYPGEILHQNPRRAIGYLLAR